MNRLRTFLMSMNILNGLLMAAMASIVYFGVIPILDPTVAISLPRAKPAAIVSGQPASASLNVSPADYTVISDQNLFHPERRIPPEKQPEKAIPKPDLFLYGTLITDEGSFAFIEDKKTPYSTAGRGKRQTTLKKGDSLQGYILRDVLADRIVLVKGDNRVVVMLNDGAKRRAAEIQAGPAISGLAPGIPSTAPSSGPPAGSGISVKSTPSITPSMNPIKTGPAINASSPRGPSPREQVEAAIQLRMQRQQQLQGQ